MSPRSRAREYERRRYEKWQARVTVREAARLRRRRRLRVGLLLVVLVVVIVGGIWWVVQ